MEGVTVSELVCQRSVQSAKCPISELVVSETSVYST